jgi:ATP-dependent Clp protease ATP-binding subunit ClpA
MTLDRDLKRIIRARMRKTGESYAAARARLLPSPPQTPPARGGTTGMYPFEQFTQRAKNVLTLAQKEAEQAGHSYMGTEHLLLGLLLDGDGLAAIALKNLGVDLAGVRQTLEQVLVRNAPIIIQQIIPTSQVKTVIETSFEEAQRNGHNYVGTEHLLMGILIEGEGIAAHVLVNLGATLEKVRAEIDSLLLQGKSGEQPTAPAKSRQVAPPLSHAAGLVIKLAGRLAEVEGAREVTAEHMQQALSHPGAQPLHDLHVRIDAAQAAARRAIEAGDTDQAKTSRELLQRLGAKFAKAEAAWVRSLRPPSG